MMKRTIIMTLMAVVALFAAATDRFYIEDFTIAPGETRAVSILLVNEAEYTAFQCDLYLPEGLSVEQEDGDYIFDLTNRKGRDHMISSQLQVDGSIRVISYSPSIKAYSGNTGALVTFNVTASSDFEGPASIVLKNILFTTVEGVEIPFADDTCTVTMILKDLTGEIVFEEGGNKTTALDGSYCIIDIYELLYISYTGEEDVEFNILVNDRNLLEEDLSQNVSWDEDNNRYVVFLFGLIRHFSDWYSAHLNFVVTIQASGYNSITSEHSSFVSYVESTDGLNISEYGSTDLSYLITVDYRCGVFYCNIDSLCINKDDDDWSSHPIYAVKRLDHDYYITILAAHKTPMSTVYSYIEKTFLIPARTSNIAIHNNDFIIPCMIYDKELGSIYYTGEQEYGRCFAFITANNIDTNSFIFSQLSVSVDNQLQLVKYAYPYAPATAINLLQFGDIYGGKYQINATMTDGYYSLSVDTVLEIHPIATRLTPDSLIIDINPSLDNITLLVNGEEVESSTDRNYYALPRLVHDYSITVQAGVKITIDYYEGENYTLSEWSDETTIIIPSKCVGDVDDNGLVNISDVTALIDYLLNNDASAINLTNADCDGNGLVNISDVTCLIDYLLSGTWH